ncbi:MAG: RT0821/Lpp0805 family surface protein [Pseudomonadota bacterium]
MRPRLKALTTALVLLTFSSAALAQMSPFGLSGFELKEKDIQLITQATAPFYADPPPANGTTASWDNPETGNRGTATLVSAAPHQGLPCRKIQHEIHVKNVDTVFTFVNDRCQVADGEWKAL